MIKVFLVEDEIVMREGIRNNIAWEQEGLIFAGEASDGELAYPMIRQCRPDIIITDIRMPFMDGLELSRLVRQELPETKIIILSGYDEFEYAKEAIKIGVTDYLVKPIAPVKLLEAVKRVAKVVEEERQQREYLETYKRDSIESAKLERCRYFDTLVKGTQSAAESIRNGRELGLELMSSKYNLLLFQIFVGDDNDEYSEVQNTVSAAIEDMADRSDNVTVIERGIEGWAFILMETDQKTLENVLADFIKRLKELVSSFDNIEYFGGIGRDINRLSEMNICFSEANRAFAYRYLQKRNCIVDSREEVPLILKNRSEDLRITSLDVKKLDRNIVESFLRRGLSWEVPHFINEYIESLGETNIESMMFRQYVTMDIYFAAISITEQLGFDSKELVKRCGDFQEMLPALSDVEQIKSYLEKVFNTVIELRESVSRKKNSSLLHEAAKYIDDNFANEDISLNTVAAHVNLSPNHFSTLFSQEMGKTFIEYLTAVRMEKAKEFLRSTNMKSTDVAFAVGYKDPHYFSYLFKKTQDCTPREFRTGV